MCAKHAQNARQKEKHSFLVVGASNLSLLRFNVFTFHNSCCVYFFVFFTHLYGVVSVVYLAAMATHHHKNNNKMNERKKIATTENMNKTLNKEGYILGQLVTRARTKSLLAEKCDCLTKKRPALIQPHTNILFAACHAVHFAVAFFSSTQSNLFRFFVIMSSGKQIFIWCLNSRVALQFTRRKKKTRLF